MTSLVRSSALLATVLLLYGCAATGGPRWTYQPGSSSTPTAASTAAAGLPSARPTSSPIAQASGAPAAPGTSGDSVLPVLTPKADLKPVPAGETNVAYAPNVPPAATRDYQAIVDVHFDVVEGAKAIDPKGTQYTTWGYRLHSDTTVTTGTPGPIIRARVGDVLRFSRRTMGACLTTSTFTR
jgi:hypothetical protein